MTAHTDTDARQALADRLVDDTTHALETLSVYLGLELRLYRALADLGTATQAEVAGHVGIAPRYAREWLEQQAAAGYLACDDPTRPAGPRARPGLRPWRVLDRIGLRLPTRPGPGD